MKKTLYKASSAIATLSLLASSFTGLAAADLTGTAGNDTTGADSHNEAEIKVEQSTFVDQSNQGQVVNKIDLNVNTGGNEANKNTGEGHVETGDILTGVGVSTSLNRNVADLESCGGCELDLWASNNKTGYDSKNEAEIEVVSTKVLEQQNKAEIKNFISQDLNTGDNEANKNTGMGTVSTGSVVSVSLVANSANKNIASVGGGNGSSDPTLTAVNDTTGADSKNEAEIEVTLSDWVVQSNWADIFNDADVYVNTGGNEANKNTGEGHVETGDIDTGIGFDTEANANFLAYDGCCDVELAVGNEKTGADSDNEAEAELETVNTIFQGNCTEEYGLGDNLFGLFGGRPGGQHHRNCGVLNLVYGDLNTGDNEANKNTADGIDSGDVEAAVEVNTQENENVLGSSLMDWPDIEWGELPEDGGFWWLFFGFSA